MHTVLGPKGQVMKQLKNTIAKSAIKLLAYMLVLGPKEQDDEVA
jgi:hypothetical protein